MRDVRRSGSRSRSLKEKAGEGRLCMGVREKERGHFSRFEERKERKKKRCRSLVFLYVTPARAEREIGLQ